MQIKSDNATSSHVSARSRAHAMRRFGKAVSQAEELKAQVAKHGDARSPPPACRASADAPLRTYRLQTSGFAVGTLRPRLHREEEHLVHVVSSGRFSSV